MNKITGFFLTDGRGAPRFPPWLDDYPWLTRETLQIGKWQLAIWGIGDLSGFVDRENAGVIVGYSEHERQFLPLVPPHGRGVFLSLQRAAAVFNDASGAMPVFYATVGGIPYVSTCEEAVMEALGSVTLDEGGLASYLIFQCSVATYTLWAEISKLYGNSVLRVSGDSISQELLPPLPIGEIEISSDPIAQMDAELRRVISLYTDLLDEAFLPLSHGHDSRLLLAYMSRPERIRARTYHLIADSRQDRDAVVAAASAKLMGVQHGLIDFGQNYSNFTKPAIEYYGTPLGATQVYVYGASRILGEEAHLPVISGVDGDSLAGSGLVRTREILLKHQDDPITLFRTACYCYHKEWATTDLNGALRYDWRSALKGKEELWADIWNHTEGDNVIRHAYLIRARTRGSQYINYAIAAADLWGGMVSPYNDRDYITFMLSLPEVYREGRSGQIQLFQRYWPQLWPAAGITSGIHRRDTNTLDRDSISEKSLWPVGLKTWEHDLISREFVDGLYKKALAGDVRSFYLLNSIQPVVWALRKGYVK